MKKKLSCVLKRGSMLPLIFRTTYSVRHERTVLVQFDIAEAVKIWDFNGHTTTYIDRVSPFAWVLLTLSAWYDETVLLFRQYLWAVLRISKRTILFKRIAGVATAVKARATFYLISLWLGSIRKFNFTQVTWIALRSIARILVATECMLVLMRLHSSMTVF